MKNRFLLLGLSGFLILIFSACETENPLNSGCKDIEEEKSLSWARNEGQPIDLTDLLSTYRGPDGNDYARCRFLLECDDVCPVNPVEVNISYEYGSTFPGGSDYAITDLKLEALFWEYNWDPVNSIIVTNKRVVQLSFLEPGKGEATGSFDLGGPYKDGQVYARVASTLDFSFRIKNPDDPDAAAEALEAIISKVLIRINYSR